MSRVKGVTNIATDRSRPRSQDELAKDPPPVRDRTGIDERIHKLRELLFDAEKVCQWLSSAVNTPDLPAGTWIYIDALRMGVLGGMRNAQLLELKVRELMPDPPAAEKS